MDDGKVERACQIRRLIESATHAPRGMQRHRYRTVRIADEIFSRGSQQSAEACADGAPSFVLERVNDLAKRALVRPDGPAGVDEAGSPPARGAALPVKNARAPGWKQSRA